MFGPLAPKLRAKGWRSIIPIQPGQKRPAIGAWQRFNCNPPSDAEIDRFALIYPGHGIGLAYGPDAVVAVDVDQLDPVKSAEMEKIVVDCLGASPLVRVGKPPKFLALYQIEPGTRLDGKNFGGFEIFSATGQTVLFGRHPEGFTYTWRDASPVDVAPSDLPMVTLANIHALIQSLEPYRVALTRGKGANGGNTSIGSLGSGAAAAVLPLLRAADDPLTEAATLTANAVEGNRYPTAFGCAVALIMMGYSDAEIRDAIFEDYAALFDHCDVASRIQALETGMRWARRSVGVDAATAARSPVMQSLAAAWEGNAP
jgi:hypothetical protein